MREIGIAESAKKQQLTRGEQCAFMLKLGEVDNRFGDNSDNECTNLTHISRSTTVVTKLIIQFSKPVHVLRRIERLVH